MRPSRRHGVPTGSSPGDTGRSSSSPTLSSRLRRRGKLASDPGRRPPSNFERVNGASDLSEFGVMVAVESISAVRCGKRVSEVVGLGARRLLVRPAGVLNSRGLWLPSGISSSFGRPAGRSACQSVSAMTLARRCMPRNSRRVPGDIWTTRISSRGCENGRRPMVSAAAFDASPANVLRAMRGVIVNASLGYPDVLHVEVRDQAGGIWRLASQDAQFLPCDPRTLAGKAVEDAAIDSVSGELRLTLSDGEALTVGPTPLEAADDPPNWELITPDGLALEFGPGLRWQISPSDAAPSKA
jgi:hypothetical protein